MSDDIERGGDGASEPALSGDGRQDRDRAEAAEEDSESSALRGQVLDVEPAAPQKTERAFNCVVKTQEEESDFSFTDDIHPLVSPRKFSLKKRLLIMLIAMVIATAFIVVVAVTVSRTQEAIPTEGPKNQRVQGRFKMAAVAADVEVCSKMGRDILKQRGSAVDSMITSLLCVGVVNSQSSGLGGGMFMLIYDKETGNKDALMAREKAPAAANESMTLEKFGYKAVAVPGELSGMWEAHKRYGRLAWADLFQPVIRMAEDGFQVTAHLARALRVRFAGKEPDPRTLPQYAGFVSKYTNSDGSWKRAGDTVYAPKMARTLRAIAENGVSELQTGESARGLVQEIQDNGGIITAEDLAGYQAEVREATTFSIGGGMTVLTTPSPSGGPIVQFIINVLRNKISSANFETTEEKIKTFHRFIEASKFAFALRSYLGDVDTPEVQQALSKLQSEEFARTVFSQIRDDRVTHTNASGYDALINSASQSGGTCHISVVDEYGNAVSATSSVNYYFGSTVMSNSTGLILNNEMADFDTPASKPGSPANYIAPGKVPLSAMSPVIVINESGDAELVAGSAGSRAIITANAWIVLRSLFTDATLKEIIDEKRIHNQLQPQNVDTYETGFPKDVIDGLMDMGHAVQNRTFISIVQAIRRADSGWTAYSDPRKQGVAAGY